MARCIAFLALILALSGCEYHMQPEVRGGELEAMMRRHIEFIANNSDLRPARPPAVEWHVSMMDFARAKYGARVDVWLADAKDIGATYEPSTQTIHLPERWKPYTDEEGTLVHELVHYLQHMNGVPFCRREWERQAYQIEMLWYKRYRPRELYHMAGHEKMIPAGCE